MSRAILEESRIHPAIRERISRNHAGIIREVEEAIASNEVVVVGMAMNPFPIRPLHVAAAKRAEDVDRVADVPHGLREGRAGGRRARPREAGGERRARPQGLIPR